MTTYAAWPAEKWRVSAKTTRKRVPLEEANCVDQKQRDELLALNEALNRFADIDPRKAQVVEMKYFGRMTNEEIAEALDISLATVKRDWNVAKAWLSEELIDEETSAS